MGRLLYLIALYKKNAPPWFAGLREAWRVLLAQRYSLFLNLQRFCSEILSNSLFLIFYSQTGDSSQAYAMQRRSKELTDSLASANKASQMADWQIKYDEVSIFISVAKTSLTTSHDSSSS